MKRGFDRTERVADLIQKSLAEILLRDATDDRFRLVTITSVTVARDLAYAKVYVSVLVDEEDKIKATIRALNQSAKAFRYQLAQMVKLRVAPELKFIYDDSVARGFRLTTLINAAMKKADKTDK